MPGRWGWRDRAELLLEIHRCCRPLARREVERWQQEAEAIPEPELRRQALASIRYKAFHCEGGTAYAAGSGPRRAERARAICTLQILVDYLDNLSDRRGIQTAATLARLHRAVADALTPDGPPPGGYYQPSLADPDGGYLQALVRECRMNLALLPGYQGALPQTVRRLGGLYATLQVLKHLEYAERERRLVNWLAPICRRYPQLRWWEIAAACGSTLGIFALLREAARAPVAPATVQAIDRAYFPWLGALHILLDYYVDQDEDRQNGDLNFASYYSGPDQALSRLAWLASQTRQQVRSLGGDGFHGLILSGLPGLYLSDPKVRERRLAKSTLRLALSGGISGLAAYLYCQVQPPSGR